MNLPTVIYTEQTGVSFASGAYPLGTKCERCVTNPAYAELAWPDLGLSICLCADCGMERLTSLLPLIGADLGEWVAGCRKTGTNGGITGDGRDLKREREDLWR